jgi:hypothetical protein
MYTKEDVQRLLSDLGGLKSDKSLADWSPEHRAAGTAYPGVQGREFRRTADGPGDPNVPERYIGNRDIDLTQPRPNMHNVDFAGIEIGEPYMFGLALDAFDPESGEVLRVCRPRHRDTGEAEVFLTPAQLASAVASARSVRLHNERAGLIPPRPLTDEQTTDAAKRQEAAKQQQDEAAQHDQERAAAAKLAHDQEAQRVRTRETGESRA